MEAVSDMTIRKIISDVLEREGDTFTDDPNDSGGGTKWGITQATLAAWRKQPVTVDDVRNLTEAEARSIYYQRYVQDPGFGHLLEVSAPIAEELVDSGVNVGPAQAAKWLQRALNVFNRQQKDYPDVVVDGRCGTATVMALQAFLKLRQPDGEKVLLRALNGLQAAFYIELVERRSKDESFLFGWMLNRVS